MCRVYDEWTGLYYLKITPNQRQTRAQQAADAQTNELTYFLECLFSWLGLPLSDKCVWQWVYTSTSLISSQWLLSCVASRKKKEEIIHTRISIKLNVLRISAQFDKISTWLFWIFFPPQVSLINTIHYFKVLCDQHPITIVKAQIVITNISPSLHKCSYIPFNSSPTYISFCFKFLH